MSLLALWEELHSRRLDWAHRAYRSFLDSLDSRVRACFTENDSEVSVALFGRTQVGKTTLLLHVLGVDEKHLPFVSGILRGGREAGQSSTATAMQYHRAADDQWHLKIGQRTTLGKRQLVEALASLRECVEKGVPLPYEPVEVGIPRKYFSKQSDERPRVRILDLPGDSPRDVQEANHVRHIASRYLPLADLILIVGKLDDLSFLNPKAFTLPGISDWRYTPNRFRIITTFSFSLDSEKDWARRQPVLNTTAVRERVLEQIGTHSINLGTDAGSGRLFFPLDFGASWDETKRLDPETAERMGGINHQFMNELLMDIAASATVHGRLRQAADSHIVARRVKREESQQMRSRLAMMLAEKHRAERKLREIRELIGTQKKAVERALVPSFGASERLKVRMECQSAIQIPPEMVDLSGLATNTLAFMRRISWCCDHLVDACSSLDASDVLPSGVRVENIFEIQPQKLRLQLDKCFSTFRASLRAYVIEEYYPSFSDDFSNDKSRLTRLMGMGREIAVELSVEHWLAGAAKVIDKFKQKFDQEERQLTALESSLSDYRKKYDLAAVAHSDWQQYILNFERDMDAETARGERFSRYLSEAFDTELAERRKVIAVERSPSRKVLHLLSCKQLSEERDRLLLG